MKDARYMVSCLAQNPDMLVSLALQRVAPGVPRLQVGSVCMILTALGGFPRTCDYESFCCCCSSDC